MTVRAANGGLLLVLSEDRAQNSEGLILSELNHGEPGISRPWRRRAS
jgi:hypothetical protein